MPFGLLLSLWLFAAGVSRSPTAGVGPTPGSEQPPVLHKSRPIRRRRSSLTGSESLRRAISRGHFSMISFNRTTDQSHSLRVVDELGGDAREPCLLSSRSHAAVSKVVTKC